MSNFAWTWKHLAKISLPLGVVHPYKILILARGVHKNPENQWSLNQFLSNLSTLIQFISTCQFSRRYDPNVVKMKKLIFKIKNFLIVTNIKQKMFNLFELPLEIQEEIFRRCEGEHLQKLACCSSSCNEAVRETIWSSLNIPYHHLQQLDCRRTLDKKKLSNVKYATSLTFHRIKMVDDTQDKLLKNFQTVLSHCNVGVVRSLRLYSRSLHIHFEGVLAVHACQLLKHLRRVVLEWIKDVPLEVFCAINRLNSLNELRLLRCGISDAHLHLLTTNLCNVKKFGIMNCNHVSAEGILHCAGIFRYYSAWSHWHFWCHH